MEINVGGLPVTRPNINFADVEFSQPIANSNFNALSVGMRRNATMESFWPRTTVVPCA